MSEQLPNQKIAFANILRGFAALCVVVAHYFHTFWGKREAVADLIKMPIVPSELYPTPSYVSFIDFSDSFNLGAYGVALFFLISGFVIPFSLSKLNWKQFCVNRFFRIIPTYVAGFSVTLLAIWLGSLYIGQKFPYHFNEVFIHYLVGLRDILYSTNIDGIVWTLEIEVKFYILCALTITFFKENSVKVFIVPFLLGFSAFVLNTQLNRITLLNVTLSKFLAIYIFVVPYLVFMFIGVAFNYQYRGFIKVGTFFILILTLFISVGLLWIKSVYVAPFGLYWSYGFALWTFGLAFSYQNLFRKVPIFDYIADISYPLYVIHGIAGFILLRALLLAGMSATVSLLITLCSAFLIAALLHKYVEVPSHNWGQHFTRRLAGSGQHGSI